MDIKEAKEYLEENQIDNVRLVITDLGGMPRGKRVPVDKFLSGCEHGIAFSKALYSLTLNSEFVPELPSVGYSTGFQDMVAWPDLETLTALPWDEGSAWVICEPREQDGGEVSFDPRTLLKRQITRLEEKRLQVLAALEYEFHVLQDTPASLREKKWTPTEFETFFAGAGLYEQARLGKAAHFMRDIWRLLPQAGVPVDSMQVELGPGHFEFPIKESAPLAAADRAALFKVGVKEICHHHGLLATFMAKVDQSYEGVSGAVHHSLMDEEGRNVFHDSGRPHNLSETFDHWCEGLLRSLGDLTLVFLPTYNSYRRPLPGTFVANSTTWSVDSRATALRAINLDPQATRVEHRLPGADANPYLVLAANLAAGLYGLDNKLKVRPPFVGTDPAVDDQGRDDVEIIPGSMEKAIERFEASQLMGQFFGPGFCGTMTAFCRYELEQFRGRVTNLERIRYLEYA